MKNEKIAEELVKIAKSLMAGSSDDVEELYDEYADLDNDDYDDRSVEIEIKTGNAAFQNGNRGYEIARILRELADKVEGGAFGKVVLMDINGNKVGEAEDL